MRDTGNILAGLVAVGFGGAMILWIIPAQTVSAIFASVPSGFYPNFTSGLLILSGLGLIIGGIFSSRPREEPRPTKATAVRATAAFVLLAGAMYLAPIAGFLPTGVAICLVTLLLMQETRWVRIAAISIMAPLVVWSGFEILLGRPLP